MLFARLRLVIYATAILIPFQNCSFTNAPGAGGFAAMKGEATSRQQMSGGTGYDGKRTFINRSESVCPDGNVISSAIEIQSTDDTAFVTRQNCDTLKQPLQLSRADIGLMPHNDDNALHDGHVFDRLSEFTDPESDSSYVTKFLCRGQYANKNTKQMQVADVIIKYAAGGNAPALARVIMAVYEPDGTLSDRLDSGELNLRKITTEVVGRMKYVTPIVGRFSITLWIDKVGENRAGKLSFIDLPYAGREKEPDYNYRDYERVIQNLDCTGQ